MLALVIITSVLLGAQVAHSADPGAGCMGCHVMHPQLDSLRKGNHAKVTTCQDCHVPHGPAAGKLYSVASDGLRHVVLSSLNAAPPVIRIHRAGAEVVQANCIRCHGVEAARTPTQAGQPRPLPQPKTSAHADSTRMCVECHGETSHKHPQRG